MELSLDCLTVTDATPLELVDAAAGAGFGIVSLWVQSPSVYPKQLLTPQMESEVAERLRGSGVRGHTLEVFDLVSADGVAAYRPALELGARLGGRAATAIHMRNADRSQVVDLLAQFAAMAAEFGLGVNIEPISMGQTRTLAEAAALIRDAGVDAGVTFDFLHLIRTGGGPAEVAAINPDLIRCVQICDGPLNLDREAARREATFERAYPGYGEFPMVDLLKAAPKSAVFGVETPSTRRREAGVSPAQQAKEAMDAVRTLLDRAGVSL